MSVDTINPVPAADASFLDDLQEFLREEISDRAVYQYSGVIEGGIGSTSANLTHTISACIAFPNGHYVSQEQISHTYTASRRTCVYIRDDDSRTVTIINATVTYDGHFVFAEMAAGSTQPATPTGLLPLFYVDTDATSITSVTDLRCGTANVAAYGDLATAVSKIGSSHRMTLYITSILPIRLKGSSGRGGIRYLVGMEV